MPPGAPCRSRPRQDSIIQIAPNREPLLIRGQRRADGRGQDTGQEPASSSSQPSLMVRMLEALDLHDNDRVLEIGTGTGFNAALLCHRLGDRNVYSVDVDPN
jgi:protein-L-isoaspartate O-methyltransferase